MLPLIRVPTLIIVGCEDFFTLLPVARVMSDSIPDARLICIEGAGHLPNMEKPEEFNKAVGDFLTDPH